MSKRKRGPTLNSQARELVLRLHEYFERESANGGPLLEVTQVRERVAQAFGIGPKTVSRLIKEKYGASGYEDNVLHTPNKRIKEEPVTGIDIIDSAAIREHIYGYYRRQEYPTVNKLLVSLKSENLFHGSATSLKTILNNIGFRYKKDINGKPSWKDT